MALGLTQPTWGNASLVEIIWTFTGVVGCLITVYTISEALKDLKTVIRLYQRKNMYYTQAKFNLWQEIFRFVKMFIVTAIGIVAIRQPGSNMLTIIGLTLAVGLVLIVIITVLQASFALRLRLIVRGQRTR